MSADPKSKHSVETVSGLYLDFANPTPNMIRIGDVAWGISRQPRFCGQTLGEFPLSVAQHSVSVAAIAADVLLHHGPTYDMAIKYFTARDNKRVLAVLASKAESARLLYPAWRVGLFHDGSEGFLCDLPTPAKRLPLMAQAYSPVETALMKVIYEVAGCADFVLDNDVMDIVGFADAYALTYEAWHLLPSRGQGWSSTIQIADTHKTSFQDILLPSEACRSFLGAASMRDIDILTLLTK